VAAGGGVSRAFAALGAGAVFFGGVLCRFGGVLVSALVWVLVFEAAEWDVLALGEKEVDVGEELDAASLWAVALVRVEDWEPAADGDDVVIAGIFVELVVGTGVGVGFMSVAAAWTIPAPSVGSGTSPLTCQPMVAIGHGGGLKLGVYPASATPDGLIFFHWLARLS